MRDTVLPAVVETTAVAAAAQQRAAIESRYLMAERHPRDWQRVTTRIMDACRRPRFAEEARYKMPRGDKDVLGLSIRFAEEAARAIGNIMAEATVLWDDLEQRVLKVTVTDLEANLTFPFDIVVEKYVERRGAGDREVLSTRTNSQQQIVYKLKATDGEILEKQNGMVAFSL